MARKWQPRERRLITEYCIQVYPDATHLFNVRVGGHHPSLHPEALSPSERRLIGIFRRWVDALVIRPHELVLIEGAIYPDMGDISKLKGYAYLIPFTPELKPYQNYTLSLEYVTPILDPFVKMMCLDNNIRYVVFRPSWIESYLRELSPRKQRPPLTFF